MDVNLSGLMFTPYYNQKVDPIHYGGLEEYKFKYGIQIRFYKIEKSTS